MRHLNFGSTNLFIGSDPDEVAKTLATNWLAQARICIADKASFCSAITGGSTPALIYQHISQLASDEPLDWSRVWLIWTDERDVPLDHPDSNYRMAMQSGLATLPVPQDQVHPMRFPPTATREEAGLSYSQTCRDLTRKLGQIDWVFLGMGEDGHTASLFPGSSGFDQVPKLQPESNSGDYPLAISHFVAAKQLWRMTLTLPFLNSSTRKVGFVTGAGKAAILAKVLSSPRSDYPASWLGGEGSAMNWYVDAAAALQIPPDA